ncbi:MAG: SAF domain-containing protein [Paenibacillaceae bacterium]|uniref:SAF domain-containing protein n=1 Tax=Paenibacillus mellifer TaxID=2937794 RepID=A0A9X2BP73_9BACL|nr:SAF domain-containing protein [Paenibacillus mellifer]MBW4840768.1 SAF domain-containing protein [Paenibacillaceae bacterium]MCK8486828.1 SAF domain-containing protein [Paenibacillus mellifer]
MPRFRQKTKQLLLAGFIGVVVAGAAFTSYAVVRDRHVHAARTAMVQDYEARLADLQDQVQQRTIQGWVPTRDIPAGNRIGAGDLKRVELPADSVPADLLKAQEAIAGKYAKISLRSLTPLTETLLYEEEPIPADLRWREMAFVQLPNALKENDVIDIRIQFPTGQDYILLSKKKVETLNTETLTVTLGEAEILSLSSAIVDAYLHKASIYALAYVEPNLQSKPVPTYPVNKGVMELIRKDPNIVQKAEQSLRLSNTARSGLESDLSSMSPQRASEFASNQTQIIRSNSQVQDGNIPPESLVADGTSVESDRFELNPGK